MPYQDLYVGGTPKPVVKPKLSFGLPEVRTPRVSGSQLTFGPGMSRVNPFSRSGYFSTGVPATTNTVYDDAIMRAARSAGRTGGTVQTGNIDGMGGFANVMQGVLGATLNQIAGSGGGGQEVSDQIIPVMANGGSDQGGGVDLMTMLLIGGAGLAIVYAIASR